jgi:5'-nucleotidase
MKDKIQPSQKIYVNRSLNLETISMIGFDMDHTLASYHRTTFETLAFRLTVEKFISAGYPKELRKIKFDPNFVIRGLLIDKERGNILKVDTHKYVKIAYHGHKKLSKEERHSFYNKQSYKAEYFGSVDTFFSLSEFHLFVEIVDFMRINPGKIKKTYREIYDDLREFIDLSHKDGTIKSQVIKNPGSYIKKDPYLASSLIRLKKSGKKLFLLTNSLYEYTHHVMGYLLDGENKEFPHWKDYFDIIIVGAGKPGFFTDSQPFLEVVEESNLLKISDGFLRKNKVYHGGNAALLQKLTHHLGDEILYVGDHIYGDIIRSKDTLNWRTLLVIEELEEEIPKVFSYKKDLEEIFAKISSKEALDDEIQTEELDKIQDEISTLIEKRSEKFHPLWGELMKVGLERSRFASQVASYACLYTSKVSNLRFCGPQKRFISYNENLPHEAI